MNRFSEKKGIKSGFLFVHVDSRRRGTTPAAAGGIAEKGSDRPIRRFALKLARIRALL